jgi:hypothetical protein
LIVIQFVLIVMRQHSSVTAAIASSGEGSPFGVGKIIEMRDSLKGLSNSASSVGQFIGNNIGAITGVGAVLGVAAMAWQDYQAQQAKAAAEAKAMLDLLDAQTGALNENADATFLNDLQTKNQTDDLERAGVGMADVTSAIEDQNGVLMDAGSLMEAQAIDRDGLIGMLRAEGGERNLLLATLIEEGEANKGLVGTLYAKFAAYDAAKGQQEASLAVTENNIPETERLATAILGAGGAAVTSAADQADLATKYADTQEEIDKLIDDTLKYWDAVDGVLEPQLAWETALDNMTQTLGENGTQWDWVGNKLNITTEEGRANYDVLLAQRDAALAFGQQELALSHDVDKASAAVATHVDQLKNQWRQAGYTEEQIGILIQTLGLTPEQVSTGFNTPGLAEAKAAAAEYAWQLGTIPQMIATSFVANVQSGGSFIGNAIAGRASGGPVQAGVPYIVGEQGPELAVFGQSGTIVPAPQTAALMAGGGSQTPVVNVYIGNEQVQAKVEHGLLANKRSRTGWTGVGS